jgi:hypothetical protein
MQPVQYKGSTYYTGQYFHQMYRANSDADGKYKQAKNFLRLIRSIEAYPIYIESGDIVELTKADAELASASGQAGSELELAFKASFGKPIMLINATAQAALTHHLDDEVSKQASVAINRAVAVNGKTTEAQLARSASAWLSATLKIAKMLGTDEPMAKVVAVDIVRERVGVDFSQLLIGNSVEDAPMTSSDLGREWGLTGKVGEKMNAALLAQGFAEKNENGDWVPTEKGKPYATVNPFKSPHSHHTGYRTMWYRRILNVLKREVAA